MLSLLRTLNGISTMTFRESQTFSETELSLSKFIRELNARVAAMNCTTLLLAPLSGNEPHPEHTHPAQGLSATLSQRRNT